MRLLYKCRATKEQLENRIELGATCIELHTEREDIENVDEIMKIITNSGIDVYSIHVPINRQQTLEGIVSEDNRKVLDSAFGLAQKCAEEFKHTVEIVMHHEVRLSNLIEWGIYPIIKSFFEKMLNKYPSIRVNIENSTSVISHKGVHYHVNSYFDEPVKIAKKLREDLKIDRIGNVFDVAHSIGTINQLQAAWRETKIEKFSLREHLQLNMETLAVVHLSNSKEWGMDHKHAVLFDTQKEKKNLYKVLDILKEADYKGVIVIETNEVDVNSAINMKTLMDEAQEYLNK